MALEGPVWKFKPVAKDDKLVDPIQQEFFTTESVGDPSEALVREAVQNSLDARSSKATPVTVRIALSSRGPAQANQCRLYFAGLHQHILAQGTGLVAPPDLNAPIDYLVIEDFGTRGLLGDPEESGDKADSERGNNFFYFWRNVGRSGKSETDRGRWGLGKAVFPASSRINTFFGLTIPNDKEVGLLMGQTVLKIHRSDAGQRYHPYGDFGLFSRESDSRYFALPISAPATLSGFSQTFGLLRVNEPGLSLVIPAPIRDLQIDNIRSAVLKQYFYPILSGELVVRLEDSGKSVTSLTADDIRAAAGDLPEKKRSPFLKLLELATWSLNLKPTDYVELTPSAPAAAPDWGSLSPLAPEIEADLRHRYSNGERLAFKVWLKVQETKKSPSLSWFTVYLERDPLLLRGEGHFIREGITLSGIPAHLEGGVRGLVLVTDPHLASMLGDAENPAHTEWQKNSPKFKDKYNHGPSTLLFVKKSLRWLALFLSRPPAGIDRDLLKDIFYLNRPTEELGSDSGSLDRLGADQIPKATFPPAQRQSLIRINQLAGGVRVSLARELPEEPVPFDIHFAYGIRRGNPFRKYHSLDFDLQGDLLNINAADGECEAIASNRLRCTPRSQEFEVTVSGFDSTRDLVVRAVRTGDDS